MGIGVDELVPVGFSLFIQLVLLNRPAEDSGYIGTLCRNFRNLSGSPDGFQDE